MVGVRRPEARGQLLDPRAGAGGGEVGDVGGDPEEEEGEAGPLEDPPALAAPVVSVLWRRRGGKEGVYVRGVRRQGTAT